MGEERYKFKWSNVDRDVFVEGRRHVAQQLRLDARIFTVRAEQIEEEIRVWREHAVLPAFRAPPAPTRSGWPGRRYTGWR